MASSKATIQAKKHKYMNALLISSSVKQACKLAHISRATAQRYQNDPEFQQEYQKCQQEAMEFTGNKLRTLTDKAVNTLSEVMDSPDANATEKTRAAKIVLDSAFHVQQEEDILKRLDKLEREAAANEQ